MHTSLFLRVEIMTPVSGSQNVETSTSFARGGVIVTISKSTFWECSKGSFLHLVDNYHDLYQEQMNVSINHLYSSSGTTHILIT